MQHERNFSSLSLLGAQDLVDLPVDSLEEARAATDAARSAFALEVADKGEDVARIYSPALAELDRLSTLRGNATPTTGPAGQPVQPGGGGLLPRVPELVTDLADRNSELVTEVEDHDLRRGVQLIDMSSREIDYIARFVRLGLLGSVTGDRGDRLALGDQRHLDGRHGVAEQPLLDPRPGAGPYEAAGDELEVESDATGIIQMGPEIIATGVVNVPAMLEGISLEDDESYYGFLSDVSSIVQARADHLNEVAAARSRWYIAAAALVVAAALIAILAVSRSIVGPLKDLTRQSMAMAEKHLPAAVRSVLDAPVGDDVQVPHLAPVTVRSSDEVADVAETLNTVQTAALDLAVDQAMLRRNVADAFVNLARRNQNLIARQLDFITELERNETRTTTLENLFRLDHHATRMRRNAESLLVLAGVEGSRKWGAPVNLTDVVRAAVGEVEDFRRVIITTMDGASVVGSVASDLAHLLAELIENAPSSSPPQRTVEINGRAQDGYLLLIVDDGIGMPCDELAAANERLEFGAPRTIARPATWATTWPAAWPAGTGSRCACTRHRAPASRRRSRCPPGCWPARCRPRCPVPAARARRSRSRGAGRAAGPADPRAAAAAAPAASLTTLPGGRLRRPPPL